MESFRRQNIKDERFNDRVTVPGGKGRRGCITSKRVGDRPRWGCCKGRVHLRSIRAVGNSSDSDNRRTSARRKGRSRNCINFCPKFKDLGGGNEE